MGKKGLQRAARDHRVAVLPEYLQPGRDIWYWRESLCDEDGCSHMVTSSCPINRGRHWPDPEVYQCACRHPVLDHGKVWSAAAFFTEQGIEWVINDLPGVMEDRLRSAFFATREEAMKAKPERIIHG